MNWGSCWNVCNTACFKEEGSTTSKSLPPSLGVQWEIGEEDGENLAVRKDVSDGLPWPASSRRAAYGRNAIVASYLDTGMH